ncbi:MAG: putative DNA-binding domain-containing protein [Gammaproteobacteria bacterium]|nr:putative DNA-binding domain-containing protein [Gammaproteobacteria bacterium]
MSAPLERVQGDFQDYMLHGRRAVQEHVVGSDRVPVATRLAIYGDAYRSRLAEALESNYPALARLLGETDFQRLASEYVRTHESPFFSIRYYGDALTQFLATHEEYVAAPVLAELARWEWAMTNAFDAPDTAPISDQTLACVPPQQWAKLRFVWHPSVQRLTLAWNVPQLWQALRDETERPPAELAAAPVHWLLWRRELTTCFRSLPQTEAGVLDAARSGWPFAELCELLCEEVGESEAPAASASLLRGWVNAGLIVGAA